MNDILVQSASLNVPHGGKEQTKYIQSILFFVTLTISYLFKEPPEAASVM
jgi:hypothetical protein